MGNAMFVSDDASIPGVSTFQTTAMGHNTFAQKPQWSWIYPDGVRDESVQFTRNAGKDVSQPTALGRCAGRPGWCVVGIAGFQSGVLGATRTANTAIAHGHAQLPSNLVPTAIAVTASQRIRAGHAVDTVNIKGKLAVVSLASMCNACDLSSYSSGRSIEPFWGDWKKPYPGLAKFPATSGS